MCEHEEVSTLSLQLMEFSLYNDKVRKRYQERRSLFLFLMEIQIELHWSIEKKVKGEQRPRNDLAGT